jgi:hypothetical protein
MMTKLIAVLNVIAWSGFWAFGYLALSSDGADTRQVVVAMTLAALGGGVGLWAYLTLVRHSGPGPAAARPHRPETGDNAEGTA